MSLDTKSTNRRARVVGVLFLLPFLAYGIGNTLVNSLLHAADPLAIIAEQRSQYFFGALLMALNSAMVIAIGVLLFPTLKERSPRTAVAYVGTRIIEAVALLIGIILLLCIPVLATDAQRLTFLMQGSLWAYQIAMLVLGLGSVGFCLTLFRSKLIPSPAALLGLAGYALLALGSGLELCGLPWGMMFAAPGGLFELFLGIWLIAKGFRTVTPSVAV